MEKVKSTLPNILLSLTVICLIAGVALSAANKYTESAILASKAAELQSAIKNVTPEFDNNPTEEQYRIAAAGGDSLTVYPAKKDGKLVGCAVESYTKNGFSGLIRIMVGFDAGGKLYNYSVLEHNETPGLGSKMEEWFREDKNQQNIVGRDMTKGSLRVSKDGGDVDAITAATISSRAFLDAINLAYAAYSGNTDAVSGATGADTGTDANSGATIPEDEDTDATSGATDSTNNTDNINETK
ncbi:MAG: RnfABCDGE type electron transport complex subunit G [Tannerella sp.]|jgi:electron transport complex protein RnfG|nr:RnfABCDGE type electron transport complex subunit G [Tannerella sp.]